MCSPAVALGAQILGAAQSAISAGFGAASNKSALQSQARIADINATLTDAQARASLMASEKTQAAIGLRGAQTKATQMAGYAANGIDVGSESAVNTYASTDYVTAVDRQQAELNGITQAWGYRTQADSERAGATAARAKASGINPWGAATSSLLGSAGQVASSWYKLDSMGAFGGGGGASAAAANDSFYAPASLGGGGDTALAWG